MTLCNINQGRRSFFLAHGLQNDSKTLKAVLGQAYFGVTPELVSLTWMCTNTEFYKKLYLYERSKDIILSFSSRSRDVVMRISNEKNLSRPYLLMKPFSEKVCLQMQCTQRLGPK